MKYSMRYRINEIDKLVDLIEKGSADPPYIVACSDPFLLGEELTKLTSVLAKKGYTIINLDGEDLPVENILNELKNIGLFAKKRAIILKKADRLIKQKDLSMELCRSRKEPFLLITIKDASIVKTKDLKSRIIAIKDITKRDIFILIEEYASKMGLTVSPSAKDVLIELLGNDPGAIKNALRSIKDWLGDASYVEDTDVRSFVGLSSNYGDFELLNNLFAKKGYDSLRVISKLFLGRKFKDEIIKHIALIRWKILQLIRIQELLEENKSIATIAKELRLPPKGFLLERTLKEAKNFNKDQLRVMLRELLKIDRAIKTGLKDNEIKILIEDFVETATDLKQPHRSF